MIVVSSIVRLHVPVTAIPPIESAATELVKIVAQAVMIDGMVAMFLGVEFLLLWLSATLMRVHPHLVALIHAVVFFNVLLLFLVLAALVPLLPERRTLACRHNLRLLALSGLLHCIVLIATQSDLYCLRQHLLPGYQRLLEIIWFVIMFHRHTQAEVVEPFG